MSPEPRCHVAFRTERYRFLRGQEQKKIVPSISAVIKHRAQMCVIGCGSSNGHRISALSSNPCWPYQPVLSCCPNPVMLDMEL